MEVWAEKWLINFNVSKRKKLLILNSWKVKDRLLSFSKERLNKSWHTMPFGVHFSFDLTRAEHLSKVRSSCFWKLGFNLRSKFLLPDESISTLHVMHQTSHGNSACPLCWCSRLSHCSSLMCPKQSSLLSNFLLLWCQMPEVNPGSIWWLQCQFLKIHELPSIWGVIKTCSR